MIVDDSLREGLQSPGISFKIEEKIQIAKLVSYAGIKSAIISYPSAHVSEILVTKEIINKKYFDEVFALGRATKEDIDIIYDTGANISLHLPFQILNLDRIMEAIKYASTKEKLVEVAIVNITEYSSIFEIIKLAKLVEGSGANRIQIADTLGKAYPSFIYKLIKELKREIKAPIIMHLHNDSGLSLVNAVKAIEAGADYIDTTIFGMGERNGITDTISLLMYLMKEDYPIDIRIDELLNAYVYIEKLIWEKTGYSYFLHNFPVYGTNTNIHTAGTHASFNNIFKERNYSVNVYTGKAMIKNILEKKNIILQDEKLSLLIKKIKDKSVESGRVISEDEIIRMVGELNGNGN